MTLPTKRVPGLDGFRGWAILWVLFYHLYSLVPKSEALAGIPALPRIAELGWIGVSLFFALSGYLIIPMLVAQKGKPHFFGQFACRRAFRLLPLYAILLLTFFVASALWPTTAEEFPRLFGREIPLWSYWLFVQNLPMAAHGALGNEWLRVTWSLAVEVQFYAIIAIIVYVVPRAAVVRWLVLLTLASVAVRYMVVVYNPSALTPLVVLLPCRLDAFLLGGLVAFLPVSAVRPGFTRQACAVGMMIMSIGLFAVFGAGGFGAATRWVLPLYHLMLALACAGLLDLAATSSPLTRWAMENKPLIWTGRLSYFIYLFHLPVMWVLYRSVLNTAPNLETAAGATVMIAVLVVLFGLGEMSQRFLERPLIKRSHRYFGG
jgi:peptidoglycan/LPS O-acetylase OafA/YrhL